MASRKGTGTGPHTQDETLAATQAEGASSEHTDSGQHPPVRRIGHYLLLERLGAGGMGVVFAAYDETLGRKVAVKLLRAPDSLSGHERLRREAQALARLSHPNVVQVYELGEHLEREAYIVMEFVDGLTLGAWRVATKPSRAEILRTFAAAGRGLAAAHTKELVHRDFKPDNVMIASDGRVLVMDFGIAHGHDATHTHDAEQLAAQPVAGEGVELTATGALMGTPAYMAPEQFRGERADARSDQFSYCVALWEALYGARPFSAPTLLQLSARVSTGQPERPEHSTVPAWLEQVLTRGLCAEPEARHPSMDALLRALDSDPTWRRRVLLTFALAAALVVGLLLASQLATQRASEAHVNACEYDARSIHLLWEQPRRAALESAFLATEQPGAGLTFSRAAARMDIYAESWTQTRRASCLAAGPELAEDPRTVACLDERKASFDALLYAWSWIDLHPSSLSQAILAAAELPSVSSCNNEAWLAQRVVPPPDSALRGRVLELRARLIRTEALHLADHNEEELKTALVLVDEAEALAWTPLTAECRLALARAQVSAADYPAAHASLEQTLFEAVESGHMLVELEASAELAGLQGYLLSKTEAGRFWLGYARALLIRAQLEGSEYETALLTHEGNIAWTAREHEAALLAFERAYALARTHLGEAHPSVSMALANIGYIRMEQLDYEGALADFERALAQQIEALGAEHMSVVTTTSYIADTFLRRKDYAEALPRQREVLTAYERIYPGDHPAVAATLDKIGYVLLKLEQPEQALPVIQRALAMNEATLGAEHPATAASRSQLERVRVAIAGAAGP